MSEPDRIEPITAQGVSRLEVNNLSVETDAGAVVVAEISFALDAGDVLGLVGESGSGKTTLALALLGYARSGLRIAGGSVLVGGRDILALPEQQRREVRGLRVSYVPQDAGKALNPSLRLGEQVREVMRIHLDKVDLDERASLALERVSLPDDELFQRRFIHQLSGGQQQRLALAIGMACDPEVVVLDEPTTGLDVITQGRVLKEVVRLCHDTSRAAVFVSHDLAAVATVSTRIAVMYGGHVVEHGPAQPIITAPVHPYTAGLVASVPLHDCPGHLTGVPGTAVGVEDRPRGCPFSPRCSLRTNECEREMPPLEEARPGQWVRCFHWKQTSAVARIPRISDVAGKEAGPPILEVRGLRAVYGNRAKAMVAASDVSFAIYPGECVALVGESGSGKSTIARCVGGLHAPASGSVVFEGTPLAPRARRRSREQRRRLQSVFQNPYDSLNPSETVGDAISRPLRLFLDRSRRQARAEVPGILDRVRLPLRLAGRYPAELSGGERQRVAIARALAAQPDLLLCDEVTSALDVSVQAAVLNLLGELQAELALAILFITHDLGVVASIADRVLVLERGIVREDGTVERVLQRPEDDYTRRLIAAIPELPTTGRSIS